MLRLVR